MFAIQTLHSHFQKGVIAEWQHIGIINGRSWVRSPLMAFFFKGAQGFKFRGQLIKGFWQFWTDFFDIGTVGIVRDSQNDSGGQTIKFCSFRGSNGVKWGSTGGND